MELTMKLARAMKVSRVAPALAAGALWLGANMMLGSGPAKGQEVSGNVGNCVSAEFDGPSNSTCPDHPVNGSCDGNYYRSTYDGSKCDFTSGSNVCYDGTGLGTEHQVYGYCNTAPGVDPNGQKYCVKAYPYKFTSAQVSGVPQCYYSSNS